MNKNMGPILVVEDDVDIGELMKIFLEADGFRVTVAADGLDAFQQLQSGERPALILLYMMMPGMDGEQFLKEIRACGFGETPVVVISVHSAAQNKAHELGADSCLLKPFELDDLLNTVRHFTAAPPKRDAA